MKSPTTSTVRAVSTLGSASGSCTRTTWLADPPDAPDFTLAFDLGDVFLVGGGACVSSPELKSRSNRFLSLLGAPRGCTARGRSARGGTARGWSGTSRVNNRSSRPRGRYLI